MTKIKYYITKEYLVEEYSKNEKSMQQVANMIGCKSETVRRNLIKYNIPIRTVSEALIGRHRTEETKEKLREKNLGKIRNPERHKKHFCIEKGCNNEISYANWFYGGSRRCLSCASRIATTKHWQDKKYVTKVMKARLKALNTKPNKPEKMLNKLLKKLLPKEYKYVGNWEFIINRYNPDFINVNGQKKIIELYGDYWHNLADYKKRDKQRLITYKKYGYKTLIIWEHELKDLGRVKNRILVFNNIGAK